MSNQISRRRFLGATAAAGAGALAGRTTAADAAPPRRKRRKVDALLAHGHALREAVGDIHWAGTESSTFWVGYMDGAVRSGQCAAAEVLQAL